MLRGPDPLGLARDVADDRGRPVPVGNAGLPIDGQLPRRAEVGELDDGNAAGARVDGAGHEEVLVLQVAVRYAEAVEVCSGRQQRKHVSLSAVRVTIQRQ